jgi:Periplasmic copper-binding protein (NosD)
MPHRCSSFVIALLVAVVACAATAAGAAAHTARANVACGDVISSDTVLTGNLTCSGDGLTVTGGATLDLDGHTVRGTAAGRGVSVLGNGTSVRNGDVQGFDVGVYVNANSAHVEDLGIRYNPTGGILTDGFAGKTGVVIQRNVIRTNGYGIRFIISGGFGAQVLDNVVADNRGDGIIAVNQDDRGLYQGNLVARNGGYGMNAEDSTVHIVQNSFVSNRLDGLRAEENFSEVLSGWLIAGNVAFFNGGHGLNVVTPGIPDGGNNFAKLNSTSPQCVNVAC